MTRTMMLSGAAAYLRGFLGMQAALPPHITGDRTFETTLASKRRDGETELSVKVIRRADAANGVECGVACRIFLSDEAAPALHAAFSIAAFAVAMPEDIDGQVEENAAMEVALEALFHTVPEDHRKVLEAFREQWAQTRDRIFAYRTTDEFREWSPDHLILIEQRSGIVPALSSRMTRMNNHDVMTVLKEDNRHTRTQSPVKVVARSTAEVAALPGISGHAKLDLLKMMKSDETYRDLRHAFEGYRKARSVPLPVRASGGFAVRASTAFDYYVRFTNGDTLSLREGRSPTSVSPFRFRASLNDDRRRLILELTIPRRGEPELSLGARRRNVIPDTDMLEERVHRLLGAVLALDKPVPARYLPVKPLVLDRDHPALAGLPVPPRHAPFLATFLGAPYARALAKVKAS